MNGLTSLSGLADAPAFETLEFIRMVNVSNEGVALLTRHPTLREFCWHWEDVPQRVALPVIEQLGHLERPAPIRPEYWPQQRLAS
jgi:hypothetical protein